MPTSTQIRRWQSRDWADRLAFRQSIRARDANGGRWLGSFSGRQWKALLAACNYQCHWCGVTLPARELTCDHLYPLSLPGRRNDIRSVVPACSTCNSMRGNKTPTQFRAYLAQKENQPVKSSTDTIIDSMPVPHPTKVVRKLIRDIVHDLARSYNRPELAEVERDAFSRLAALSEAIHGDRERMPNLIRLDRALRRLEQDTTRLVDDVRQLRKAA